MHLTRATAVAALGLSFIAPAAGAADQIAIVSVQYVRENADQTRVLESVSWHMKGEKHRAVAKRFNLGATTKSTNAAFKSAEASCSRAFLSAIIQLQTNARNLGADGVIDIKSNAMGETHEEKDSFNCTKGAFVARVSLTGTPVKFR